jgi:hypothetical protein
VQCGEDWTESGVIGVKGGRALNYGSTNIGWCNGDRRCSSEVHHRHLIAVVKVSGSPRQQFCERLFART